MATATVDGIEIEYEVVGDGEPLALTAGGRFSMETPGLRELARELAAAGKKVLLWDRPNCGRSQISFTGESESALWADTLAGLLRQLDMAPAVIAGGSAGSRVSLLTAARHPDVASKLALWWISGGPFGLMFLAVHYCGASILAANRGGMEAVAALPDWAETIASNPANRERILSLDPEQFVETLERWMLRYLPREDTPVPGMEPQDFADLRVPALVFRSGESDIHHPRRTSEWVHQLIPGARIVDPPWGDGEWNERTQAAMDRGEGLFQHWPKLAPQLLAFIDEPVGSVL